MPLFFIFNSFSFFLWTNQCLPMPHSVSMMTTLTKAFLINQTKIVQKLQEGTVEALILPSHAAVVFILNLIVFALITMQRQIYTCARELFHCKQTTPPPLFHAFLLKQVHDKWKFHINNHLLDVSCVCENFFLLILIIKVKSNKRCQKSSRRLTLALCSSSYSRRVARWNKRTYSILQRAN